MLGQAVNWDYRWGQIVGRAWADDDFKRQLLADPAGALQEYELTPPPGVRITVLEAPDEVPAEADGVRYLVLPAKPSAEELSEDELCSLSGTVVGVNYCEWCRCERCHHCERCACERCGCHHPPRPDEA
jgi:hypothetical protein